MTFPDYLPIPESVKQARKERGKNLVRVTCFGMAARMSIVAIELVGFFLFDSRALLIDSIATLTDLVSSLVLIVSIKLAQRPPDTHHPFGHGKYEPLAGFQLGVFMACAGGGLFIQQLMQLVSSESEKPLDSRVWLFAFVAVFLLEISFRKVRAIAKKEQSAALLAEAMHFRIDSLNSVFALFVLGVGAFFPHISWFADRLGAALLAIFMAVMGTIATKKNLDQLVDRIPEKALFTRVCMAAKSVEGVSDTEKIKIQQHGPDAHVDIDIEVDPHMSVEKAHEISQKVRRAIQTAWPQVLDVTVHIEPYYANDH